MEFGWLMSVVMMWTGMGVSRCSVIVGWSMRSVMMENDGRGFQMWRQCWFTILAVKPCSVR